MIQIFNVVIFFWVTSDCYVSGTIIDGSCYSYDATAATLFPIYYEQTTSTNSYEICTTYCGSAPPQEFAALISNKCFCPNIEPLAITLLSSTVCNSFCPGNASQHCGNPTSAMPLAQYTAFTLYNVPSFLELAATTTETTTPETTTETSTPETTTKTTTPETTTKSTSMSTTNGSMTTTAVSTTTTNESVTTSIVPITLTTETMTETISTTVPTTTSTNQSSLVPSETASIVNISTIETTDTASTVSISTMETTVIISPTVNATTDSTATIIPTASTTMTTTVKGATSTAPSLTTTNSAIITATTPSKNVSVTITTPGPTTIPPIILPESNVSYLYPDTTTSYYGDLTAFNSTTGATNAYSTVNSLIGFGSAISLNKNLSQCMNKSPFVTNKSCLNYPDGCQSTGLSFSIWTLVLYDNSVYDMTNLSDADSQYFLSTGADTVGHPGVSLGVKKQWLFALVSTGTKYWYTQILGQISNNTWNNVGVRWSPSLGLEVYVNATKVGSTNVTIATTALPQYSIPTLMIGCQKTASDSNYSGYFNGYCDEVAVWDNVVPLTSNLSLNFLGGYSENTSHISPAEFQSMLANIQINNPGQQAAAVKILSQLTSSAAVVPPAATPTATQASAVAGTAASPTSAGSTAETVTTPAPANVQSLKTIGTILLQMMDPTRLPATLTPETAESFLQLSESFSNILGPDNIANWQTVQKQTETVGVMQLIQQFRAWHSKLMQSITYTNDSVPICNEIVNKNLYIKYCKMTICDFGVLGKRYTVPDYARPSLQQIRNMWNDTVTDRIAFPTQIFPDDRCCDRPVSFIFHYYGFAEQAAVSIANPMFVSSSAYNSLDSRIMNLDIVSDPAYDSSGNIDTKEPLCNFDDEAMSEQQLLFKSSHMDKNVAQIIPRKLLLFENQTVTDVQQRYCCYWNENLTDYGAWDSPRCGIVEDTSEYSKCACSNVGIFSILAVKNEPIVVPEEPQWIHLVKYIFYGLSVLAVTIYIVVVLMSGELKDLFHLVGLHLAIAILIGSIAMVISDFASVQDDRNACTLVGTIIHIFYGAVGTWILCLGHASFNAITSGIIGGRLLSYSTISWGIPLAFAGVPFITMLSLMGYDPRCFIGWDNIVKWVFFAPQMACVILASFFAIVILCNLSTPALRKENLIHDYGTFCRGAALLILYLSITWTFGLVTYMKFGIAPNFYPIFQVLNSLSGVCLLVLIGFGSERFRSTLAGKTQARREMLRQYAFGLPNSDDIRRPQKMQSDTPSAASTSNLIPDESNIPSEELQAY